MSDAYKLPADWGTDPLAKFIEDAHHNIVATFANCRSKYDPLVAIDRLYGQIIENLNQSPEFVAGFFLFRTHSSYRAAVRLGLGGQVAEAYMVLRGCLESALYGHYVAGNTARQETWLRRHDDDASLNKMKGEFTIRKVMDHLESVDPKTQAIVKRLYDQTINYGGHPNERAITTQVRTKTEGSRVDFTCNYFLVGDLPHAVCIKSTAQVGICCLDIFYNVFQDRYRLLGIDEALNRIRQGF